jgi:excisionase family DNA binding protein
MRNVTRDNSINNVKLFSVNDVANALGVGRLTVYKLLKQNAFKTVRVGRSLRVPENSLIEFVQSGGNQQSESNSVPKE